jgi:hypothetical protein
MSAMVNWLLSLGVGLIVCALFGILLLAILYAALAVRFVIRAMRGGETRSSTRC